MTIFRKAALAVALAATALVSTSPAQARDGWRHRGGDDTAAIAIGAGIIGLAVGAAVASSHDDDRYYDRGYYYEGGYAYPRYRGTYYRSYPAYRGDAWRWREHERREHFEHRGGWDRRDGWNRGYRGRGW